MPEKKAIASGCLDEVPSDILALINHMRRVGAETETCEVKQSRELPENLVETVSAFANTDGGTVILGLSEHDGFKPVQGFDAARIVSSLIHLGDEFTPVLRFKIATYPFEGGQIVVLSVPAVRNNEKPCYITARGMYMGSFVRVADADRRMTPYEVERLLMEHQQPMFDLEPVVRASLEDLDDEALKAIVARQRTLTPRFFGKLSAQEILLRSGVLTQYQGTVRPTLGGLLATGLYPQQFFPRLHAVFTIYPGTSKAQERGQRFRYLDSRELNGSIPDILLDATALLRQHMRSAGLMEGVLRRELTDYPVLAFREALVNALQHRDYAPAARSSQVQINLYADHLEILSPGGLYGTACIDLDSPGISSTRNVTLSKILEMTPAKDEISNRYVIENKGTGLIQIRQALLDENLPEAEIQNYLSAFRISFVARSSLINPKGKVPWETIEANVLRRAKTKEGVAVAEIVALFGINRRTATLRLNRLVQEGVLERTAPAQSPLQRYRFKGTPNEASFESGSNL